MYRAHYIDKQDIVNEPFFARGNADTQARAKRGQLLDEHGIVLADYSARWPWWVWLAAILLIAAGGVLLTTRL